MALGIELSHCGAVVASAEDFFSPACSFNLIELARDVVLFGESVSFFPLLIRVSVDSIVCLAFDVAIVEASLFIMDMVLSEHPSAARIARRTASSS
jgi:hypothetical protein